MTLRHLSRSHSAGNGGRPRQTSNLDLMDKEELEGVQGSTLNINRSRTNKAARKPVFQNSLSILAAILTNDNDSYKSCEVRSSPEMAGW
jgi:hypothetical protein